MASPGHRWRGSNLGATSGSRGGGRQVGGGWRGRGHRRGGTSAGGNNRSRDETRNIENSASGGGRGGNFQRRGSREQHNGRLAETPEQQRERQDYISWKQLIKRPPTPNDTMTMELLWNGALTILDQGDREWKQALPRDLDAEDNFGREHIQTLMSMESHSGGCGTFVAFANPFLSVITHSAMVDCLSVDTFVGGLYNFISGTNGKRAVLFFRRLCTNLTDAYCESVVPKTLVETTLINTTTAVCELLRREQRAAFHEDLPDLVNSLQTIAELAGISEESMAFQIIVNRSTELRAIIARANGLLVDVQPPSVNGISSTVLKSTYPRDIFVPGGRYDNDANDITKINILPTEDEIRSDHPEFLPTTDFDQPHFLSDPVARHLDTQFRLLRHDIFGELKEFLGGLLDAITEDPTLLQSTRTNLGDIRAYYYPKAQIRYVSFDRKNGIQAHVSFPQVAALWKKSASDRRKWWEDSKRLEEGALLCLVSLVDKKPTLLFLKVCEKTTDPKVPYSLSSHEHLSTIVTKLVTHNQEHLELLIRSSSENTHIQGALIEFPGVVLATFIPILENIQNMQRFSRLPFRQWILPDLHNAHTAPVNIPPPLYTRNQGFLFSLDSILKRDGDRLSMDPRVPADDTACLDKLEERTSLDRGQCQALVAALTREFAFIQGPPGTGKSFLGVQLMRVLLASKAKADLGPVVVVCYTNHALDQFLEHLVEIGIEKIIRIGSQSKSQILEGKNLRVVSQGVSKTRSEGYLVAKAYEELGQKGELITKVLGSLHSTQKKRGWTNLKKHLQWRYPRIHEQFSRLDEDGFEVAGRHPFELWSQGTEGAPVDGNKAPSEVARSRQDLVHLATGNVYGLTKFERRRLVDLWVQEVYEEKVMQLFEYVKETHDLHEDVDNVHDEVDRRVLQSADVIGVTTTGLAKRISVLQRVHCKVIICEEAGEVMEPHIISALLPSVEHFIQIGDHQQLRPQIVNHGLSLESKNGTPYQLDRSQFERLSMGAPGRPPFPVAQLNVQRRMRPEISTLIRTTIYPRLIDHETTKKLPDVVGMRKNVFWLDHGNIEAAASADRHQKSHSNDWEVDMTHALVRHIVRQGVYSSTDIAVLTPYTGQLQKLRAKMRNDFEIVLSERDEETLAKDGFDEERAPTEDEQASTGNSQKPLEKKKLSELLRIATVDNFQGEESKIIVISLVRSNQERKVGFLKTTNRINVLLSRGQHGMYLIGNSDTYSNIPMWAKVLGMLQATNSVGKAMDLCCPRHRDTVLLVSQPLDFEKFSPEGGCQLPCDRRLNDCGHMCLARCHSDSMHAVFKCPQPCQRLHTPCNHICKKQTCGEDCGLCMIKLDAVQLPCRHFKDAVPCYRTQDLGSIKCSFLVQKQVPNCSHVVETSCSQDVTSTSFICPTACSANLPCGHSCPGTCGKCNGKNKDLNPTVKHQACTKICGRRFGTCNHTCRRRCHDGTDCGPCPMACEVKCSHSQCTRRCHEPCAPCIQRCTWSCEHRGSCDMPCSAPCNRLPCNQRCSKTLLCGHRCPGVCGEACAEGYCHECCNKLDARVDFLEMKSYGEVDVDETPIVVLGCDHFFTAESLDGLMSMSEVYNIDGYGEFIGLKDVAATLAQSVPCCPDCKCPVRQYATQRYNRVINRAVIDEMSKRFLTSGRDEIQQLEQQVINVKQELDKTQENIMQPIRQAKGHLTSTLTPAKVSDITKELKGRYTKIRKLELSIKSFRNKVADKHQPAQKLHDATIHAARNTAVVSSNLDEKLASLTLVDTLPTVARDRRITMGGQMIQIKTEFVALNDKFAIDQGLRSTSTQTSIKIPGGAPGLLAIPFFQKCKTFIDECNAENLPKLVIEVSLFFASIARSFESLCRSSKTDIDKAEANIALAKQLLENAQDVCNQPFRNAKNLRDAVEESLRLMRRQWYEEVTAEEISAIKAAMVSGSQGITTHSGHWYNCENGHPFAIGECGMPMQLARCPECGASVGGENHTAVSGVTRATNMEN